MTGRKDDAEKLRWSLLPLDAVEEVVKVLEHGAQKYGEENWRKVDNAEERYWNAAMRHMVAYAKETNDPESGLNHLVHAAASLLFILELGSDA